MTLHNRATDGEAYSHAAALGRVEGVEESVGVVSIESDARITDAQVYISCLDAGDDHELSRTIFDSAHGIARVQQQIEDHLLKLDAVAFHWRQTIGQLEAHSYTLDLELAHGKRDDLSRRLVQVD
jgi:hypothetical protein